MFASRLQALSIALAALSFAVQSSSATPGGARTRLHPLTRELEVRTIPALLRASGVSVHNRNGLLIRQADSCDVGYLPCSDGSGCCETGSYCGEWGGKLGCCPTGETCEANPNQECDFQGYSLCKGEDFCCPTGDTCSTSGGSPQCLKSGFGGGSGSSGDDDPFTTTESSTKGAGLGSNTTPTTSLKPTTTKSSNTITAVNGDGTSGADTLNPNGGGPSMKTISIPVAILGVLIQTILFLH